MIVTLASSVIGQLTVTFYQPAGFEPFALVAILACLALVPTALSSSRAPDPLHEVRFDFKRLIRVSLIAVIAMSRVEDDPRQLFLNAPPTTAHGRCARWSSVQPG